MNLVKHSKILFFTSLVVLLTACSRTRNTWVSRNYHQLTAKYNPLFNAEEALLKAKNTVKQQNRITFDILIPLYLVTPEPLVPLIEADVKRANEKATKAIREHNMIIAGKQLNKTIKNAYFVIGEAYYLSREFFKAIEIFSFISREYNNLPIAIDADIYIIKSQTQLGNYFASREVAAKHYKSRSLTKNQQLQLLKSMSINETSEKKYEEARKYIQEALLLKPQKQEKIILMYHLAQLFELEGNYLEASKTFKKVIKSNPPYSYQINAYLRMAANYDPNLMQSSEILADLNKLAKKEKNRDYLDAIYYHIADIYIKDEEFDKAFMALDRSIQLSTDNNTQKGLSYIRRGDLHFDFREYIPAEANYDSALAVLPRTHFRYQATEKKKKSLTELVHYLGIIAYEDSVLKLSTMERKQLDRIIDQIIEQRKRADEESEQEDLADRNLPVMANRGNNPASQQGASGGGMIGLNAPGAAPAFYFYNQNLLSKGFAEFTNKWGSRKLEDNWRRKNKEVINQSTSAQASTEINQSDSSEGNSQNSTDPRYTREYYYARIPSSPDSIQASHRRIQNASEAAARIYKDVLSDGKEAIKVLENLLKRYPDCDCVPRVYYTLCLISRNYGLTLKKETYCDGLLKRFPESSFAALLTGKTPDSAKTVKSNTEELAQYRRVYQMYRAAKYSEGQNILKEALNKYENSEITPKWWLLDALISAKISPKDTLKSKLERIISTYPQSEEATEAQNILKHLSGEASAGIASNTTLGEFTDVKTAPHQYMLVLENKGLDLNTIRSTISNFNTTKYSSSRLQMRNILMGREYQLILVSGFSNQAEALQYFREINQDMDFLAYIPKPNHQVVITSENFRKFYQKQMLNEYVAFFDKYINLASNSERK